MNDFQTIVMGLLSLGGLISILASIFYLIDYLRESIKYKSGQNKMLSYINEVIKKESNRRSLQPPQLNSFKPEDYLKLRSELELSKKHLTDLQEELKYQKQDVSAWLKKEFEKGLVAGLQRLYDNMYAKQGELGIKVMEDILALYNGEFAPSSLKLMNGKIFILVA